MGEKEYRVLTEQRARVLTKCASEKVFLRN